VAHRPFQQSSGREVEKYVMADDEVMFMFRDGPDAWDSKDFFIEQERCEDVKFEKLVFCGKYSEKCHIEEAEKKEAAKKEAEKKKEESSEKEKKAPQKNKPIKSDL
jgi:hypothetical protein